MSAPERGAPGGVSERVPERVSERVSGSVPELLEAAVGEHPDREALVDARRRLSYAQLDAEVDRVAAALHETGVTAGDRVAVSLPNCVDVVTLFLGVMRLGAVWVGVNRALAPPEQRFVVDDVGAGVVLAEPEPLAELRAARSGPPGESATPVEVVPGDGAGESEWHRRLAEATAEPPRPPIDPHAPAAVAYTSGTTGTPKGVVHSQHNILVPAAVIERTRLQGRPERAGICLPLTILNVMILGPVLSLTGRGCSVCMDRIDAAGIAALVRRERIEHVALAPATVHDLVTRDDITPEDLASLTRLSVGGAGCPEWLRPAYEERFGRRFTTGYGLTEAPTAVAQETERIPHAEGASGKAMPHVRVEIRDERGEVVVPGVAGEICVAPAREGPWRAVWRPMLGYWNRPDATAEALRGGVLHTGDRGWLDEEGYLHVDERGSDVILRGGANVYPAEVERVLADHPAVADAVVFGREDPRLGQEVVAAVEHREGRLVEEAELREHCRERLAAYKVPVRVVVVGRLPRNEMGKVPREALADLAGVGPPRGI